MPARRILLRLAAFFAAFAAAVALVLLLAPAPPRPFRRPPVISCGFAGPPAAAEFDAEVELVTLDREARRSYTRLRLAPGASTPPPARLYVRTYFFTVEGGTRRVWTQDAVELRDPSAAGRGASFTVAADCDWCADAGAPRGGYFARVQLLRDGAATPLPAGESFFDIRTAAPVVVRAERRE